jgi:hypothetical protein
MNSLKTFNQNIFDKANKMFKPWVNEALTEYLTDAVQRDILFLDIFRQSREWLRELKTSRYSSSKFANKNIADGDI